MKALKGVVVVATIVAAAAILGACDHSVPMKLGAGDVAVEKTAR